MNHNIDGILNIKGKNLYIKYQNNFNDCPTLVFLHDSLGCTTLWRDFPMLLAQTTQCNVLLYDRLGYGKSDAMVTHYRATDYLETEADILNDLLTNLKIDKAILFGHSDGGSIALIAASKYGQRIMAAICEAAHIFVENITLKGIYKAIEAYKSTNLQERLQKYHGIKTDVIFKAWTQTWTRDDFRNWSIKNLLPAIKCPVLFIQGDADEYGTLAQVQETINSVGGKAEAYVLPNIGHTPHKEVPGLILKKSTEFINTLINDKTASVS